MEELQANQNFQIYPAKQLIVPNDRASKKIFNLTLADLQDWIAQQDTVDFIEILQHKKLGKILSPMKLFVEDETFTISEPLDQFHCAVLCAGISELYFGNHQTTPAIIYRAITGKVEKGAEAEPSKKQLADILEAIELLMRLQMKYDMSNYCQTTGCNDGKPITLISSLLPCRMLKSSTANGKDTSVIELLGESPLLLSAQIKNNQLLMYNNSLLDVPNMNNSRMNIAAKHYGMRRVQESSLHRQMSPTIKLADYFNKLRIENAHAQVKKDAREVLVTFFEHLQAKGVIKSFELTKRGNAFDALHFTPCKTAKKVKFKR
ncbi:MAG: hypothetical protein IJP68_02845 [Selenomonadaceae bacterium]|nr:hypothetical protein [Selenomonadaceae bacterium]